MAGFVVPTPVQQKKYLFIDGANLRKEIEEFTHQYLDAVVPEVSWNAIKGQHQRAYYFDAIPVKLADEDDNKYETRVAPKRQELAFIERQAGFHVRAGDVRHRRGRGNEQKMVDVWFAVEALQMAQRGLFGSVTLMIGDLDFKPLVDALVALGIEVHLIHPRKVNGELLAAADTAEAMNLYLFQQWTSSKPPFKIPEVTCRPTEDFSVQKRSAVVSWTDAVHGPCLVLPTQDGGYRSVAMQSPYCHEAQIWQIEAQSLKALRTYAADYQGLMIPAADQA